jgi:dinuclear metal center YbgI/SA1388 family protein
LDTTEEIIDEALEKNCNLIISFHPIIFSGIKKITPNSYVEKIIIKAIEKKISIYSIHTSLDNHPQGVNYEISKRLGLINSEILIPKNNNKIIGMGRIGELQNSLGEDDFICHLKNTMKTNVIRHSKLLGKKIKRVAVLGGSGAFGIENSISQNADAYVTATLLIFFPNNLLCLITFVFIVFFRWHIKSSSPRLFCNSPILPIPIILLLFFGISISEFISPSLFDIS